MSDDEQRGRGAASVHRVGGLLGDLQSADDQPVAPRRRADAERNRAQILSAAEQLFAEQDPRSVTMGEIAKAAGVGRATLYRSFPDPSSVAVALLDEHERRLQGQLIYGPPPLGPGAPAGERLAAFYLAMLDLLERHLPLALGAETGPARFRTGAYGFWRVHVRTLLVDHGVEDPDPLIDIALSPLSPELFQFQRHQLGLSAERIGGSLAVFARRLLESGGGR
ncbi:MULTISPECIES: TetR/AcrR family transcriptional regulator [Streptomyces]|jgi:AcrR family transcriptional regulator|uniref:AcrR family transcriptional regulator n=1 Tax=Streptomyces nymphaeiformis TaxID=2663842 RepID=A0A7W7XE71_9ACTN|nr:TetR/AcrR family transcriptional regulator [Streptomyces nymphaeiformis]MBB4985474.1 AcrR family transcriptional regulator [Streptomyces nymphaeiformis]